MHVRDAGEGPALILLHAFPCDGRMWEPQARAAAAAGWRVLVPDLPGFGTSPLPEAEPSLDGVAQAVHAELMARDIERAVVGGVSLGGYVAMALVRRYPSMVAGLMLCDTKSSADGPEAREQRERLAAMCLARPDTGRILEESVLPNLLGDTTRSRRPEVVEQVRAWLAEVDGRTVAWYQRAMAGRPDSLQVLADMDLPTLVVWGEEDVLSPRSEQDAMVEVIGDARLALIPGAGHLANVEAPEAVTSAMVEFLGVVKGPRTS